MALQYLKSLLSVIHVVHVIHLLHLVHPMQFLKSFLSVVVHLGSPDLPGINEYEPLFRKTATE